MNKNTFIKLAWAFAPLGWGLFTWLVRFYGSSLSQPALFVIFAVVFTFITLFFFRKSLESASSYKLECLGYPIYLPSWKFFLTLPYAATLLFVMRLGVYPAIRSIAIGALLDPVFEEFITRGFLIKYAMTPREFFIYNLLSSLSFSFMHCFYGETLMQALTIGHFGFSFALGIIVYKTRRIELSIILHMLSNVLLYTIPVIILGVERESSFIPGTSQMIFYVLFYLSLGLASSSIKD